MDEQLIDKKGVIQKQALDAVASHYRAGIGCSMGVGKTLIGLKHMANEYDQGKRQFLVVAPKVSIYQSWIDDAVKFDLAHLLPFITFTTYRSLSSKNRDFECIYLDECHSLLHTHDFYLSTYGGKILGLTGTPPRYQASEKGEMVNKYCPIVYSYITDDAVDAKILNDYHIIVHKVTLGTTRTHKVTTKSGGFFMTSELDNYNYWSKRIDEAISPKERGILRIMRMQALMQFHSKEHYVGQLLSMIDKKCLIFCNTTEQADRICTHAYHTKCKDSEVNLAAFKSGSIDQLSCVQQLSEGINIPELKYGIIMHSYSNERKSAQKLGRFLRLSPDDKAVVHVLMYENTVDEEWVYEALKDFDQNKITYMN